MPEETRRGSDATGVFGIRRVALPVVIGPSRLVRAAAAESNKENVPPAGYAAGQTWRRTARKSPLPEWYPRTPLRDITAIVNALERRRLRVLAARAAQANRDNEASPQTILPTSPSQEQIVSSQTLPISSTSDPAPTCNASFLSPIEHPLQLSSGSSSFSPSGYNAHQISSISGDLTPRNAQLTVNEEKLCNSIDQIEKIVMKNLKRTTKKEPVAKRATQRRTLMSMR